MERKILPAKKPSRKLAAREAQPSAGQREAGSPSTQNAQNPPLPQRQQQEQAQGSSAQTSSQPPQPQQQAEPPKPQPQPQSAQDRPPLTIDTMAQVRAIRVPDTPVDLEAQWAKSFVENIRLKAEIAEQETVVNKHVRTIEILSSELKDLRVVAAEANPQIDSLESQLSNNDSQLSLLLDEAGEFSHRTIAASHGRISAQWEASNLRRLNATLQQNLTCAREKIGELEALNERMRSELDIVVEERLRASVLEAENAHLRSDMAAGMEQMRLVMHSQQELSLELNAEDLDKAAEEEYDWSERLEQGENLGTLGINFRGDSIWDECEVGHLSSPVAAEGGVGGAARAAQTSLPPAPALLLLSAPTPPLRVPAPATATATAMPKPGPSTGTQTDKPEDLIQEASFPPFAPRTSFLPHLLLLLSAFLFALHADRLAAEREVWSAANDTARGLVAAWRGEWWSGGLGEWLSWELEMWSGVDRGLMG